MEQYFSIKEQHPDKLLLYRLGDFYEMFFDDAKTASQILNIALTKRQDTPMCGVPHHALKNYLYKLVQAGQRVALVEQLEEAGKGVKLVKRGVSQIITPGTITDIENLEQVKNNFLAALYVENPLLAKLILCDITTGELLFFSLKTDDHFQLSPLLQKYSVSELLYFEGQKQLYSHFFTGLEIAQQSLNIDRYEDKVYPDYFKAFFQHLKNLDISKVLPGEFCPLFKVLLKHIFEIQSGRSIHFQKPVIMDKLAHLHLDYSTIQHLELLENAQEGSKGPSLFRHLNKCKTAMGSRHLRLALLHPYTHKKPIEERLNRVDFLLKNPLLSSHLQKELSAVSDIQRLSSRLKLKRISPKECLQLRSSLEQAEALYTIFAEKKTPFDWLNESIAKTFALKSLVQSRLLPEVNSNIQDGAVIDPECSTDLYKAVHADALAKEKLQTYLAEERQACQLSSLKLKYTDVAGYFFELSKNQAKEAPEHFIHKQTMVNATRYLSEKLIAIQSEALSAREKQIELEKELFDDLLHKLIESIHLLFDLSSGLAELDLCLCFASLAQRYHYVRPQFHKHSHLEIVEARHPVLEASLKERFIANSLSFTDASSNIHFITGPNMSGKSTYLRQNAILILMAQMGCMVPCQSMTTPVFDGIYTRIGASDNLNRGESTFMVEMNETASILKQCSERSFVILDEIGRGTSTYDGLSLAWSILEYLSGSLQQKPKVLFASHYHELVQLEEKKVLENYTLQTETRDQRLLFSHKIQKGFSGKSYGIEVAKLAGLPKAITDRAGLILIELEKNKSQLDQKVLHQNMSENIAAQASSQSEIEKELSQLKLDQLSPMQALLLLDEWKKRLHQ